MRIITCQRFEVTRRSMLDSGLLRYSSRRHIDDFIDEALFTRGEAEAIEARLHEERNATLGIAEFTNYDMLSIIFYEFMPAKMLGFLREGECMGFGCNDIGYFEFANIDGAITVGEPTVRNARFYVLGKFIDLVRLMALGSMREQDTTVVMTA